MRGALPDIPVGIMFHRFVDEGKQSQQGSLTSAGLARILNDLSPNQLLNPDEWLERLRLGQLDGSMRCITFDDGLQSQYRAALPVLEAHGVKAFWFIPTGVFGDARPVSEVFSQALDRVEDPHLAMRSFCDIARGAHRDDVTEGLARYRERIQRRFAFYTDLDCEYRFLRNSMTPDRLKDTVKTVLSDFGLDFEALENEIWIGESDVRDLVEAGHEVGLHSHSQPFAISDLPVALQEAEYRVNSDLLTALTGDRPVAVAHPLGDYSPQTLEVLAGLGVICGFRSDVTSGYRIAPDAGRLEIARIDAATFI